MTRDEAKALLGSTALLMFEHDRTSTLDGDKTLEVIDQIFDYFGEQLQDKDDEIELLKHRVEEAMKPKTCEGCNHLFFDEIEEVYKCINDVSDDVGYLHGEAVIRNIKDFYCVQYRSKG